MMFLGIYAKEMSLRNISISEDVVLRYFYDTMYVIFLLFALIYVLGFLLEDGMYAPLRDAHLRHDPYP